MKIEYLEIKNYKQFSDLTLDLTYPKGHEKEGEPLDKICIIGQSGTGKTNLLEVIRDKKNDSSVKTVFIQEKTSNFENIYFVGAERSLYQKTDDIDMSEEDEKLIEELTASKYRLLAKNSGDYGISVEKHRMINNAISSIREKYKYTKPSKNQKSIIDINDSKSWTFLKDKIDNYEKDKRLIRKKYSKK